MKFGILFLLLAGSLRAQTTWYVDVNATPPGQGTQSNPYASIQYAHNQSTTVDGDTIRVLPGTYHENILLQKRITVVSTNGPEETTLMPATTGPIANMAAPPDEIDVLFLDGFTITGLIGPANEGAVRGGEGTLRRCIIHGNHGNNFYGVKTVYDSNLVDCTVVDNDIGVEANTLSDAIWLKNCIVWGNGTNVAIYVPPFGEDISYCAGGPFPYAFGPGILVGDPGLWGSGFGDYHLRPGSPCIDAGHPALLDPDGSPSDIGYYSYDPLYAPLGTYCSGKLNSDGCVPEIAGSGLCSVSSPNPFLISATLLVPGTTALLIYSLDSASTPFQGGILCLAPPLLRAGWQISAGSGPCGGVASYDFNPYVQSGFDPALQVGRLVYAQWYQRDLNDPAGFGSGLTNALRFGIAP